MNLSTFLKVFCVFSLTGLSFAHESKKHYKNSQNVHFLGKSLTQNQNTESSRGLRILIVGDTQGNGREYGVAHIVPQLIKDMEARKPDYVLFTGDLVGVGSVKTLKEFKKLTAAFGTKRFMVPGNHDLPGRSATNGNWSELFDWLPKSQEV